MKNNISPGQIPHLVRVTADLFRKMMEEVKAPNMNPLLQRDEHEHMHFMTDLLKDLVDAAYPVEAEGMDKATGEGHTVMTMMGFKPLKRESLDKALEEIAGIMKGYKPPKAGEF